MLLHGDSALTVDRDVIRSRKVGFGLLRAGKNLGRVGSSRVRLNEERYQIVAVGATSERSAAEKTKKLIF